MTWNGTILVSSMWALQRIPSPQINCDELQPKANSSTQTSKSSGLLDRRISIETSLFKWIIRFQWSLWLIDFIGLIDYSV